jgi:excinuclease UvrABC nuclease subunit
MGPGSVVEVSAAVELLNRDQAAAITEQAFERAADLRERAEALRHLSTLDRAENPSWQSSNVPNVAARLATVLLSRSTP